MTWEEPGIPSLRSPWDWWGYSRTLPVIRDGRGPERVAETTTPTEGAGRHRVGFAPPPRHRADRPVDAPSQAPARYRCAPLHRVQTVTRHPRLEGGTLEPLY